MLPGCCGSANASKASSRHVRRKADSTGHLSEVVCSAAKSAVAQEQAPTRRLCKLDGVVYAPSLDAWSGIVVCAAAPEPGGVAFLTWSRTDHNATTTFCTGKDGPLWPRVRYRSTRDLDTGELLEDRIDVERLSRRELFARLARPMNLETTLW